MRVLLKSAYPNNQCRIHCLASPRQELMRWGSFVQSISRCQIATSTGHYAHLDGGLHVSFSKGGRTLPLHVFRASGQYIPLINRTIGHWHVPVINLWAPLTTGTCQWSIVRLVNGIY